jgi:hypothetical protein
MGNDYSKDYASQRTAENELLASHQRLWASVSSEGGVHEVALDKVGRKYFANGYSLAPFVSTGINPVTIQIHKHHKIFERLNDDRRIITKSNEEHQNYRNFTSISDVASVVSAFAAPVQIWQAHREHRLNRLRSVVEAIDAEVRARVTAFQSIKMNSIATAIAHEEMQFDVFADSIFFNRMKFISKEIAQPAQCALVYRIENSEGYYGTESKYKFLVEKLPDNSIVSKRLNESEDPNVGIKVNTEDIEYRRTRIMFTTSGKVFIKPMEIRYSREGVMTLLPAGHHAFIAATDKMKPVSAEQLKWTSECKGDWLSLVGCLGEIACACDYTGIPTEARKVIVRTQWPAPVIYALCTMIRYYTGNDTLRVNQDGVIYSDNIGDILSCIGSSATYEIDGHMSSAWEVITDKVYSLAFGSKSENIQNKTAVDGHNKGDIKEPISPGNVLGGDPASTSDRSDHASTSDRTALPQHAVGHEKVIVT